MPDADAASRLGGRGGCRCNRCNLMFERGDNTFLDLTVGSTAGTGAYDESRWGGTTIFETGLVSFVYERGWRQGFAWAGFPGVEEEAEMALERLKSGPTTQGGVVVDASCGSGLFTRALLAARDGPGGNPTFRSVVALDFSANMLKQTAAFLDEKAPGDDRMRARLVRADIGRLPFPTGSVDGVHAGAAIHCWPSPVAALAEVARVLAPGGVFVGSTFLTPASPLEEALSPLGDLGEAAAEAAEVLSRALPGEMSAVSSNYRWWTERELRDLSAAVGLEDFRRVRRNRFILFSVRKPKRRSGDGADDKE